MRTNPLIMIRAHAPVLGFLTGVFLLCSCSEESLPGGMEISSQDELRPVTLTLDMRLEDATRSGRDLWSREPLQQLSGIEVYMFHSKKEGMPLRYVQTLTIPADHFIYTVPEEGGETHDYKLEPLMENGYYTFLASGFEGEDDSSSYILSDLTSRDGGTAIENITVSLKDEASKADEFFAGRSEKYEIGRSSKELHASIVLHRVPAGVLAYFEHIPFYKDEGKEERVTRLAVEIIGRGMEVGLDGLKATRQSEESAGSYLTLLSFDLTGMNKDKENNWCSISASDWNAEGYGKGSPEGIDKVKDSVLSGRFILPFANTTDSPTMRVVLYAQDKEGKKEMEWRSFDVVCLDERGKRDFDILANNYYALGEKYRNLSNSPEDPGDTPDKPIDLTEIINRPDAVITIYGSWQADVDIEM